MDSKEDEDFGPAAVVYVPFHNMKTLLKPLYGNYQVNRTILGRKIEKEKKKEISLLKDVWKKRNLCV